MTQAADLLLTNGEVRTLTGEQAEAVATRNGRIVAVGREREIGFLDGVETTVIDLDGRTLLPGFIDAHTHLDVLGQQQVEADLSTAESPEESLDRLAERREETSGWVVGFGYDESRWDGSYLTRDQLDRVSTERPVVAFREDLHLASVNSVVLDRFEGAFPTENVRTEDGEPTGVLVEEALSVLREELDPGPERMRRYLLAAQEYANRHGVTTVHDMVRSRHAPRIYRQLDEEGELTLRVRLNYWSDYLDAVLETGLHTNHGSDRVEMGAIKIMADGSFGGRTARLSEPYADGEGRGEWVTDPAELRELVERVDDADLQLSVHAIGDEATETVIELFAETTGERHRVEHAELLTQESIDRLDAADIVVSAQPNFLKWARADGLYAGRLGDERRKRTNPFRTIRDRDIPLAFGSDCMPMDPLFGIEQAVTAPEPEQRLDVTEAISAYTAGGASAGFAEDRLGRIEPGYCADFVVLDRSPWASDDLSTVDVELTVVDGEIVYDSRD